MTTPARAEMRADLARAMGWANITKVGTGFPPGMEVGFDDEREPIPDPFTNAADKDKLVVWLTEQSPVVWGNFTGCLIDAAIPFDIQAYADWEMVCRAVLTAPLETIAEAAWRAIQEEAR